jgi:type I restriction enzyme, S subunit
MAGEMQVTTFQHLIDEGVIEIGDGYRAQNNELGGDGPIFLRAGHVTDHCIDFTGVERFHAHLTDKVRSKMSQVEDTIITTKGNSTGRTSYVTDRVPPFVYSPHLSYWRSSDPKRLCGGFLRYWSQYAEFTDQLSSMKASTDMAPYLSLTDQRRLKITLPPIAEQKAIASVLGALDDKIELNRRMNATLEAIARVLFQSWFVDFAPVRAKLDGRQPAGLDPATSALFPDQFYHSETGKIIPAGWAITKLGDEVDFQTGFAFPSDRFTEKPPGIRLARGMNVKEGEFFWSNQSRYWPDVTKDLEQYLLDIGDVLIGMDGSKVGKNWVRVRRSDLPCLLVQRVARLRSAHSVGQGFISLLIGSATFRDFIEAVKTGTSIPHISGGQIKEYSFFRPPIGDDRLFHAFEALVAPMTTQSDKNYAETEVLAALRDTLLPKLLSGELSVASFAKRIERAL